MIALRLRNFRGCASAEIELDLIALVAGRNGAGKSSLAQAAAAALTGNPLPFGLATKGSAAALVKSGADQAIVYLKSDEGMVHIEWPACAATSDGSPPVASSHAAGLDSVALLPPKERAQVLSSYLRADPTREDLAAALTELELGAETVVAAVWKLIEEQGWDGAHSVRREKGAELKGAWREITKQNYGTRIGVTWAPAGWTLDLDSTTEAALIEAAEKARQAHEKAIGAAAVSAANREATRAEADDLESRKDPLRDYEAEAEKLAGELDRAREERAALPPGNVDSGMPCPHCGAFVVLRRINVAESRLEKAETVAADELKQRREVIAEADGRISNLEGRVRAANQSVEQARARMQMASEAAHKLAQMPPPATDAMPVEETQNGVTTAEARLNAWRSKQAADYHHVQISGNDRLLEILAADGLRAKKLGRVLDLFNSTLGELAQTADWAAVAIAGDMSVSYGGRTYALLSTSEQYRVRAVLQVAMARLDNSAMVVLDAADVLDGTTRSGLFALLEDSGLPALVCMTLTRREQVPDLEVAGLGQSYWLEGGNCTALSRAVPEAAG